MGMMPPGLAIVVVLTLPMPAVVVGWVVRLMDLLFKIKVARGVSIFHLITFVAALLCVGEAMHLRQIYDSNEEYEYNNEAQHMRRKAFKWRAERNLWIASFTLLVYWMILRIYSLRKEYVHKANEVSDLKKAMVESKKED